MELAIILMMILIVISAGAVMLSKPDLHYAFKKKEQLFTPVERTFMQLLEQAVGHEFKVICRVRLSDLVTPSAAAQKKQKAAVQAKAGLKYIDFVLCDKNDMQPVLAIDLVHRQGNDGYKTQKDMFVSNALDTANLPLARIKVKSGYTLEEIRDCVETKLIPLRRKQQKLAATRMNPEKSTRPTRPLRSSRAAA